jgi:hypothetical protein
MPFIPSLSPTRRRAVLSVESIAKFAFALGEMQSTSLNGKRKVIKPSNVPIKSMEIDEVPAV